MSQALEVDLFIFVLASFLGYAVIAKVPGLLHTPLMSLTNALSAISIVGSLLLAGAGEKGFATLLGSIAVFAATTNIVSGFLITDRHVEDVQAASGARRVDEGDVVVTDVMNDTVIPLAYLFAAACFILALKWLSHPTTARRGVRTGEIGMLVAVVATLFHFQIVEYRWLGVAIVAGVALGVPLGLLVPMTAVPQRTALSHAFGALAAGLVGTAEYYLRRPEIDGTTMVAIGLEVVLGFLTVTGSSDRSRQAPGNPSRPTLGVSRSERRERVHPLLCSRHGRVPGRSTRAERASSRSSSSSRSCSARCW